MLRLGDVVLPAAREALAKPASLELRRRLEQLIAVLEAPRGDALRSLRAVEALEYLGTPAARKALHTLADGAAAARQTQDARKALARLESLPSRER